MKKEAKEEETYYSPKVGDLVKLKKSKKSLLSEYVDILSKVGSEYVEIRPGYMKASKGHVFLKTLLKLDVSCMVKTKELKKVVKHIVGDFKATLTDTHLEFSWGENWTYASCVEIESLKEEPEGEGFGKELLMLDNSNNSTFYHSLVAGSVAVGGDHLFSQHVHYNGDCIASTDNNIASFCNYNSKTSSDFAINELTVKLWREINLPTKYICIYENGVRFMVRDDIIIGDKSYYAYCRPIVALAIKDKLNHIKNYIGRKFKISEDVWKKLKMFKDCKEITFRNNEITGDNVSNLKMQTHITPFEGSESFTIDLKQFFKIKHLVTDFSDFAVASIDVGSHINKYLVVEPEVGYADLIVIGGVAEENKNARMD